MYKLLILTIITLSLGFSSCNKKIQKFTISGTVSSRHNYKALSGVHVYLDAKKIVDGVYNSSFSTIANTETNSSGHYSFEIEQGHTAAYRFRLSKADYFDIEKEVSVDEIEAKPAYNRNFEMTGEAWIELIVKNTMPQNTNDEIDYRYTNVNVNGISCCNNKTIIGIGADYTADNKCKVQSNAWIHLEWVVKKNGGQISYGDSIHTTLGQTIIYRLNY